MGSVGFEKLVCCGNDFVLLRLAGCVDRGLVASIADRRFGVGCDQVLVVGDFSGGVARMSIYNHDGSESLVCGNGFRCVAARLMEGNACDEVSLLIGSTRFYCFKAAGGDVVVNMGMPVFERGGIPMRGCGAGDPVVEIMLLGRKLTGMAVGMGNPHLVFIVDFDVRDLDLSLLSKAVLDRDLFSEGVNISVVRVCDGRARVYERGAGETLSCGSGACAIFSVGKKMGLKLNDIVFEGGSMRVERNHCGELLLSGDAGQLVATGEFYGGLIHP